MPTTAPRRLLTAFCLVLLAALAAATPAAAARHHRPLALRTPTATSTPGGIRFSWPSVSHATRYRVVWSAKPGGGFLDQTVGGWLPRGARSATLRVGSAYSTRGTQRAQQTALPYGNPVYARLQARTRRGVRSSAWTRAVFPGVVPSSGAAHRVGTFNMAGYEVDPDHKVDAMYAAIRAARLDVLTIQEASGLYEGDVAVKLGGWQFPLGVPVPHSTQQIIWNPAVYGRGESRIVYLPNFKESRPLYVPCQRLIPVDGSRPFWVAGPHLVVRAGVSQATQNAETAQEAAVLADAMTRFAGRDPVIIAGDLTSNRQPYATSSTGAQQVLVQRGYWDTRAAARRYGVGYSTVNGARYPQPRSSTGVGSRADYILTKGIRGASFYANRPHPTSDHNLVWAEIRVPR